MHCLTIETVGRCSTHDPFYRDRVQAARFLWSAQAFWDGMKRGLRTTLQIFLFLAPPPLLTPSVTLGSTLAETRGFGTRAMGMGGAFTAVADDVSAVYYNPAGLAQIYGHHLHIEYLMVAPRLYLQRGSAPREVFLDKWTQAPMVALVTDLTQTMTLPRRLVLGFGAYFPDNFKSAWKVRYGTERFDPYYPMYGDSDEEEGIGIWASSGFQLFPWLLVGAGFNFMLHAKQVEAEITLSTLLEPVKERCRVTLNITTEIFPIAGILIKPMRRLRLGCAWRKEGELLFGGGGGIELLAKLYENPQKIVPLPLSLKIPIQSHYRPTQYAFGASYQVLETLLVSLDCTIYDWRPYKDDAERRPDPPMKRTMVPRIGLEYLFTERIAVRTGYAFQHSPLVQQRLGYHTNLLDNDVHTLSWGVSFPLQVNGVPRAPAEVSLFYQIHLLAPRTFADVHQTGTTFRSSGLFHSFGGGVHFRL